MSKPSRNRFAIYRPDDEGLLILPNWSRWSGLKRIGIRHGTDDILPLNGELFRNSFV